MPFQRRRTRRVFRVALARSLLLKTYKDRLYPTPHQRRRLEETLETCRRWFNLCLAERKSAWENEHRSVGKYEQLRQVKAYRRGNEYAGRLHSHILQVVVQDVDQAFQAFFRRVQVGQTHWSISTDNGLGLLQEAPPLSPKDTGTV
jgi:transposase